MRISELCAKNVFLGGNKTLNPVYKEVAARGKTAKGCPHDELCDTHLP